MSQPLLQVDGLTLKFAGLTALDDVSFEVNRGEIFAIIGPNGAGKSSLFNCLTGVYRPQAGSVRFQGKELIGTAPHRIAALGVARTFQNVEVFPGMTVLEYLLLSRHNHTRTGVISGALWFGRSRREEIESRVHVDGVMEKLGLASLRHTKVGSLPHGVQKRVELGRVICMEPEILLLDEPVAGMNHEETQEMVQAILEARDVLGLTVVLVEHDMAMVMGISDRVCVLDFGRRIALGEPAEIAENKDVQIAYLGGEL